MPMRIFQRLFSFWGSDMSNPEVGEQSTGPGTYNSDSGVSVSDEDAMKLSAVWACVQIITDSVSSLPLNWYRLNGENRKPLEDTHFLSKIWRNRPNAYMKHRDFRRAMTLQLALWNNAYAKIDYGTDGEAIAITPLHPARMTVYRDESGLTYHYHSDRGVYVWADKSILHLKGMGVEGNVGLNRSDFARDTYGVASSANKYAAKQFANGGNPGGVLTVDKFLTTEQRASLKQLYENMSQTAENANRLWVLEGGTSYQKILHDPNTMQMIESRQFQQSDIARFFGVPDVLIGAGSNSSSAWPASFEQQQLSFLTFTLNSYLEEWEQALMDALVPVGQRGRVVVDHDEDDFIRMDSTAKSAFLSTLTQNGLMTRNEGRKRLRLTTKEGGDDLTVQVNLTPLDELEKINGNENEPTP